MEIEHGRYVIKTFASKGGWVARAYRGTSPVGDRLAGDSETAAIEAVREVLDQLQAARVAERAADNYPTATEVREALGAMKLNITQELMLRAHMKAAGHVLSASELAKAAGHAHYVTANGQYGRLGKKLAEALEWQPAPGPKGVPCWTLTLATGDEGQEGEPSDKPDQHWRWRLRPQLVEALTE